MKDVATFLRAVGVGDIDKVRAALSAAPQLVNAVGPHPFWGGRPQPLHVSIESKRVEIFHLLLDSGADINGTNDEYDRWSPLMIAISSDESLFRDELLRRGARVGLLEALMMADDTLVGELLRDGSLPDIAPNRGSILAFARTPFAIDRLIELGAPTELKDRWGSAPIDAMSRLGAKGRPLVQHMIARGIAASPQEYARLGDIEKLRTLFAEQGDQLLQNHEIIKGAVDFAHHDLVRWLLSIGADVNARSSFQARETLLHSAAWNGDLAMVTLLTGAGADVSLRDEQYDGTPLGWALTSIEVTNNPKCAEVAAFLGSIGGSE